jgi:hypothetical protein
MALVALKSWGRFSLSAPLAVSSKGRVAATCRNPFGEMSGFAGLSRTVCREHEEHGIRRIGLACPASATRDSIWFGIPPWA